MYVTVAICTWNRADLLDQTLTRMRELRIPEGVEWELIIVNNNCTDHTDEVIARHTDALPIRRILESRQGHSHARNRVLSEARGDLLLWTDDDVLVDREWLVEFVKAAVRHPDAAGFGGPIEPWFPVPPDVDLVKAFPALAIGFCGLDLGIPEGTLPDDAQVVGANMAHRLEKVGRLRCDTRLGMTPIKSSGKESLAVGGYEDYDFNNRLRAQGERFVWVPTMRVKHYVNPARMTLDYLRSFYAEGGRTEVRRLGIPSGPRIFGVPRWLIRLWIEASFKQILFRQTGPRATSLEWERKRCVLGAMISECRAIRLPAEVD
jgi:glycosyltransferase involved in cell wall biosynthesis